MYEYFFRKLKLIITSPKLIYELSNNVVPGRKYFDNGDILKGKFVRDLKCGKSKGACIVLNTTFIQPVLTEDRALDSFPMKASTRPIDIKLRTMMRGFSPVI